MAYKIDNPMTHVKVNNEIDLCEVTSEEVRKKLEVALQKKRISYFLRFQEPGFLQKVFRKAKNKIIFCINSASLEIATEVIEGLQLEAEEIKMLGDKSKNEYYYADN